MRTIFLLLIALLIPQQLNAQVSSLFKDYTALQTPRAEVPVGALWIPSIGPSGPAASDNVSIIRGVSSNTLNSTTSRNIGFSLGNFLGLSSKGVAVRSLSLSKIEIHRVSDIGRLNISAGQQFILEAVKAGTISFKIDRAAANDLNAQANAKNIPILGSVAVGLEQLITLDGSDLFVAYQIASLSSPEVKIQNYSYKDATVNIGNKHRFLFYGQGKDAGYRITEVRYQNLRSPRADGFFETLIVPVVERQEGPTYFSGIWDFTLPRSLEGKNLKAFGATIRNERRAVIVKTQDKDVWLGSGPSGKIEMRTTTFRIERIKNPDAGY